MKGIRFIELWANIKANIVAFLSIAMFVCLGIGLFLGIQWGAVALRNTALDAMEQGNMHDIAIQFPYGITKDDLKKLKQVEGVSKVECGYSSFVVMEDGNNGYTLKMQSLPKSIDVPTSIVGNLPMEHNEVALLKWWAEKRGIVVGDTIKLKHDATSDDDSDGMQYLTSDTYEVTALVDTPECLYKNSASLGVSSIGSGDTDCVGFVTQDAFDTKQYQGGYPNVYITCDSMEGISVFTSEYNETIAPIVDRITELGGTLGNARYKKLHDKAQSKLDDAQQQIDEGEKQIAEGQEKIDEGEQELVDSVTAGAGEQSIAQTQLQEAYRQLVEGQAKYDAGVELYNAASDVYNEARAKFDSMRGTYDRFLQAYYSLQEHEDNIVAYTNDLSSAIDDYTESQSDEDWEKVETAFSNLTAEYKRTIADFGTLSSLLTIIGSTYGLPISAGNLPSMISSITRETIDVRMAEIRVINTAIQDVITKIGNASITVSDTIIYLTDIPAGLQTIYDELEVKKAELSSAAAQLEAGWANYTTGKAEYDAAVAEAQVKLQESQKALQEGKEQLKEKSAELDDGKVQLEDAKEQFNKMVAYEWVVLPRQANGSVQGLVMITSMMDNVKWAMASLFILVGLFVCYSAISRLVHEQIVQIGTKKALGFREGEVTRGYLGFSGLAVLLGVVASVALAIFMVQGIMNPKAAKQFTLAAYGPYLALPDVLIMGGIELLLIFVATWFAIHGLLKRHAIDLLKGESTANVKEHFYERTRLWQRMSLFSQTVVNNCVNDKRRVLGTLVGVIGCTALIVTAVTLSQNIALSLKRHYETVYSFDSIAYLTEESTDKADSVAMGLYNRGITSAPAYTRKLQVRDDDGTRSLTSLVVPTNEDSFKKFYNVVSTDGQEANIENGGLWVSEAYAEHQDVKVGDKITLTEFTGKTHTFTIAGFFDYYLLRQEFVLSQNEYRQAFGQKPQPNVLLVNLDGADIDRTREALSKIDGYSSLVDDRANASYAYDELNGIMNTVVLIYLILSALMALMVLLNLDIMFVDEKKRELIVLMINGFSTREAKAYIYRDSIVLTILGILLGVVLGAVMGGITVYALEPSLAYWIKGFNVVAGLAGIIGAGLFATLVLLYALRRIPRFDLTDINRF
ncbi:MAG: hypothetical protein Q4A07_06875 [Coriobacteriales bacterium]|nr:hypothetical protein [Coriobacteriales bacterium]